MTSYQTGNGSIWLGDCLELMRHIPDGSVDMVLCDLPHGTTQNKWDTIIPFEPLWREYWRVCKPNAAIVLTAAQPFTSALVMSQIQHFKYDWIWRKEKGTGHLNAKKMPMRDKEDITIFYKKQCNYNPQFTDGKHITKNYGNDKRFNNDNEGKRYPVQVIDFPMVGVGGIHPTQKPVALFEYLIKTYTNPGDLVLDNCIQGPEQPRLPLNRLDGNGFALKKNRPIIARLVAASGKLVSLDPSAP